MPKINLSNGEVQSYSSDIFEILMNVPLHHINEIIELAYEGRKKEGEIQEIDFSTSDEEMDYSSSESSESSEESSEEEENDE